MPDRSLRIVLGIATANRPDVLAQVLPHIARQTRQPDRIVVCAPRDSDMPDAAIAGLKALTQRLLSPPGLCIQRNHILSAAQNADIVVFFDDDFLPAEDWLMQAERVFLQQPDVMVATGHVIADGIGGPGYDMAQGLTLLQRDARNSTQGALVPVVDVFNGYGCNMAFRMAAICGSGARFDETLPLYGWLEDVDFSRQLAAFGRIVRAAQLRGVHLGTKTGRSPGRRLGYSQIANPVYLHAKGSVSARHAARLMLRNMAANSARALHPEPWIDRRGRLWGNLLAVADWARGRLAPLNATRHG